MTQDAVLAAGDSVEKLCSMFQDPHVGAAYGRQIARRGADPIERHGRMFNYPAMSEVRTLESRKHLGFKAVFFSNSFAIYRRSALEAVGGFPLDAIVSEEVTVVGKMLVAGWKIAYAADAVVIHSHSFTLAEEFSRYFDIGVHHGRESWLLEEFGGTGNEGFGYVRSEFRYLLAERPFWIPYAALRILSKYFAYRLGKNERFLPAAVKQLFSAQQVYWQPPATDEVSEDVSHQTSRNQ
jgi:rhamnosyltransferase